LLASALERNKTGLSAPVPVPLSYISYRVAERETLALQAVHGALLRSSQGRQRFLDVSLYAGMPAGSAAPQLPGVQASSSGVPFPLEEDAAVINALTLRETQRTWSDALTRLATLRLAPDWAAAPAALRQFPPVVSLAEPAPMPRLNVEEWSARLRALSGGFNEFPQVLAGTAALDLTREVRTLVDSTGNRLSSGRAIVSLLLEARGKSYTGVDMTARRQFEASSPAALPREEALRQAVVDLGTRMQTLARASDGEPYAGPVLLEPAAAAVFLHEVLGRQLEAGPAAARVGSRLLPAGFHLFADPTLAALGTTPLWGAYPFDDEGVAPRRSQLVENGILKLPLAGRATAAGADGHARRGPGSSPAPRLSTLLLEAAEPQPAAKLSVRLVELANRQRLAYALIVSAAARGDSDAPGAPPRIELQAVSRISADGRVSAVRGLAFADPAAALATLTAAGGEAAVFNSLRAGRSGDLRSSAVSPSLLLERAVLTPLPAAPEDRPPVLRRPSREEGGVK
jgi:hypothetical protein